MQQRSPGGGSFGSQTVQGSPPKPTSTPSPFIVSRRLAAASLALLAVTSSPPASAQQAVVRPERVPAFAKSVAGTDDTRALVLNPANLGFIPGREFRWHGVFLEDDVEVPWQGQSLAFASPMFWGFAGGIRADFMSPPRNAGLAAQGPYQWWTWGLAYRPSPMFSAGTTVQASFSSEDFAASLASFSFGLSVRPVPVLGISLVAADVNSPENGRVDLTDPNARGGALGRSFTGGLAVRPLGTRTWEIGMEAKYLDREDIWVPRATMGVDIPYVGRLSGDVSVSDAGNDATRAWLSSVELSLYGNAMNQSTELSGGVVTGDGLGTTDSWNAHAGVAFKSWREPVGIDPDRKAVTIRIEDTLDARAHVAFLRQLWDLAEEPYIDAVVLELRASPVASLAHAQELRDALYYLRTHGKRTLCHLEDAGGAELYLCSAANKVLINPGGGVRFAGMRMRFLYFKELMNKLGVDADFVRIGPHKSAPERFMRRDSTDVSKDDKIDLLQQHERQFSEGVAVGRNMSVDAVRKAIDQGPFVSAEAKKAGFVDGYAFDDQIQAQVNALVGRETPLVKNVRADVAPKAFGQVPGVALIYVEGDMVDGRSRTIPLLGLKTEGSYTIAEAIKAARESQQIRAIVLRVESPGGSSMAADVIWREVQLAAKAKPVVVSMGAFAASGGYYISAPATRIFANPLSITGSIGIYYGKADVSGLLRKIGVDVEVFQTSPRADAESIFRPFTTDERKELQHKIGLFYDQFLRRVAEGRKMKKQEVDKVGQGRVWTGEQAFENGLVDEVGGLRQALTYARKLGSVDADSPVIELPTIQTSLLGQLLGVPGLRASELTDALPPQLERSFRAMAPFLVHADQKPLARLPFVILD